MNVGVLRAGPDHSHVNLGRLAGRPDRGEL